MSQIIQLDNNDQQLPPMDWLLVHPEAETPPDVQTLVHLLSFSGDDLKKKRRAIVQDGSKQQTGQFY